jgi:hypothetical protein
VDPASLDGSPSLPRLLRLNMAAQTPVGKDESQSPYSNPEPESGKNNPFACNVCKRNYSRVDHLARYVVGKDSSLALYVDSSTGIIDLVRYTVRSFARPP